MLSSLAVHLHSKEVQHGNYLFKDFSLVGFIRRIFAVNIIIVVIVEAVRQLYYLNLFILYTLH